MFLQIEVGQLLPLGQVNQTTAHWQDLPIIEHPDKCDKCVKLEHEVRNIFATETVFNDKFVTGDLRIFF